MPTTSILYRKEAGMNDEKLNSEQLKQLMQTAPWRAPSVMRQIMPPRAVPITSAEQIIPIARAALKRFEELPLWMQPNTQDFGKADIREYWESLTRQLGVLKGAIDELESK